MPRVSVRTLLLTLLAFAPGCLGEATSLGGGGRLGPDVGNPPGEEKPLDPNAPPAILGEDLGPVVPVPSARFPRLTHAQWERTVTDLLGLAAPPGLSASFTPDPLGSSLFGNDESVLLVTSGLWRDYQRAAEELATRATATAADLARFVPASLPTDPAARARAFVEQFGKRAFRRPLTAEELQTYGAFFAQGPTLTGLTDAFVAGVRVTVQAMLQSPHFLYRVESTPAPGGSGEVALGPYELATRLSYLLLGTMPPPELVAAAEAGALDTAEGMAAEATRLLQDARAKERVADFHRQLFKVRQYENIQKDGTLFPEFTAQTPRALQREHELFVESVVFSEQRGLKELLTAPYTFVNRLTAPLYGLSGAAYTDSFQRVELDPAVRRGLLTQAGFLSYFGTATQRNTILRGAFVNLELLCANLPPPPAAVPPLPPAAPNTTNRERIEAHTGAGTCGGACHGLLINPIGYGLERFDAAGRAQTLDNGKPIDASASYAFDGELKSYPGAPEMVELIASSVQAHRCYQRHWIEFALGRRHQEEDRPLVAAQGKASLEGASIQALLVQLVSSKAFRFRAAEVTP